MAQPRINLDTVSAQLRQEVYAYIRSKVGDPAAADDLTQETFLRVEKALGKGTDPEHFRIGRQIQSGSGPRQTQESN